MDDFTTRTYGTSGGQDNRPLFGETSARDRIINLVVGGCTSLVVLVTIISAFVFPSTPPRPLNVFFAVCILLTCGSTIVLIFWYRQGDLEPKFRKLIYYMLASIVLLCICANLYFHDVNKTWQHGLFQRTQVWKNWKLKGQGNSKKSKFNDERSSLWAKWETACFCGIKSHIS